MYAQLGSARHILLVVIGKYRFICLDTEPIERNLVYAWVGLLTANLGRANIGIKQRPKFGRDFMLYHSVPDITQKTDFVLRF